MFKAHQNVWIIKQLCKNFKPIDAAFLYLLIKFGLDIFGLIELDFFKLDLLGCVELYLQGVSKK